MHTNTMHHAWYSTWYKGNTQRTMHKRIKMHKNKRNVTKNAKTCKTSSTMAFKKTMATFRNEQKGGPTTIRDPLKRDPHHKTRQGTHKTRHTPHNLCDGGHSPSPIRPRTPRRSAHLSLLVENPVDNSSNPCHNVTAVMWKTPKPVENPVENSDSLWKTLWKTPRQHDPHHHI